MKRMILGIAFIAIVSFALAATMHIYTTEGTDDYELDDIVSITFSVDNNDCNIVFSREVDGVRQIFKASEDFNTQIQLTDSEINCVNSIWSPNGEYIAFDNSEGLFIMDRNGENQTMVVENTYPHGTKPSCWHNNGNQIIYSAGVASGSTEIRIVDIDGGNDQVFVNHDGDTDCEGQMCPTNSNLVAYLLEPGSWTPSRRIMLRDMTTGNDTELVPNNGKADHHLSFNPDGTNLLWSECSYSYTGYFQLKTVDIETSSVTILVDCTDNDNVQIPSRYSPNGESIFYSYRKTDGTYSVFRCNADGTGIEEIFNYDGAVNFGDIK